MLSYCFWFSLQPKICWAMVGVAHVFIEIGSDREELVSVVYV